ncbi:MAG TPA: hypothetical protein VEC57_10485 [Candidatus Limnocylindrales bacterium]|nr:hypothetical protein [Candidatus Limnocylindrales bacterium]
MRTPEAHEHDELAAGIAAAGDAVEPAPAPVKGGGWGRIPERGSLAWLRIMNAIYRGLGRRACLWVLYPVAFYFTLFAGTARRASRGYLATLWQTPQGRAALGREPGLAMTFRHIHEFSINIFDRMVAWGGGLGQIRFTHDGSEILFDHAASGRGAILMGAHLGSFDMMRLLADKYTMTVNVLMFTRHAARINTFFEQLDPTSRVRVLEVEPGSMRTAFVIKECIDRGEFVGILGDRIHPGGRDRPVEISFLGRPAMFSLTPFLLATLLGCPLIFTQCLRLDDATYESSARLLGDGSYPRRGRALRARQLLEAYVAELERSCFRAPYQWFNFFDYWQGDKAGHQRRSGVGDDA